MPLDVNPFLSGLKVVDCGDIPVTPYDNKFAIQQIEEGHKELLHRTPFSVLGNDSTTNVPLVPISADGKHHPRIITLGGDHTIVLPLLRSIYSAYGQISVIHFDSHLDTWKPSVFGGAPSHQAEINHGTYFYWASQEGLIKNGSSIASTLFFCEYHAILRYFALILVYCFYLAWGNSHHPFRSCRLRERRCIWIPTNRSSGNRYNWYARTFCTC